MEITLSLNGREKEGAGDGFVFDQGWERGQAAGQRGGLETHHLVAYKFKIDMADIAPGVLLHIRNKMSFLKEYFSLLFNPSLILILNSSPCGRQSMLTGGKIISGLSLRSPMRAGSRVRGAGELAARCDNTDNWLAKSCLSAPDSQSNMHCQINHISTATQISLLQTPDRDSQG